MPVSPGSAPMTAERRLVVTLWCAGLAAFASMYAPQGLLPQIARDVKVDASQAALLISAATLGLALSVLPWSWVSDRIGLRTAMRAAAGSAAVCAVVVPFLPTFEAMLAGRLMHGVALGGVPALAMTLTHDIATPSRAATVAGSYVAATSVGGLSGRLLAVPVAEHFGWRTALLVLGVAVAVMMVGMIGLIPAPAPAAGKRAGGALQTVLGHLRDRAVWPILLVGMLLSGAVMTVFNYLPFRLAAAPYGLEPAVISLVFLTYLGGTVGSRATGWLGGRFGAPVVLGAAGALVVVGAVVTVAGRLAVIVAGVALLTIGFFVGHAVASSMVAARVVIGRSQATALYTIAYYSGSSIFGWAGGIAWSDGQWFAVATLVAALGVAATVCTTVSPSRP
ncbi:MFS transporter [Mycolicibacterium sp. BiH015]|uniref:MFS transporter n=1 Tax=Mycolicibacterium sp. BiH015 TaxID=3018808 RepID=UPI0022E4A0DC|nr:MFS transporter [Mycolicibacterium sp. BiH015]MDA2891391.1 MFS transporter [Mycolicibacterium sp. BiH015]